MATRTDSPQIAALRLEVSKTFGRPIKSRSDFESLASKIQEMTHEHIAENTLRRIWGCLKGYATVFTRTLDVLSRYCGYTHWASFCDNLKKESHRESDLTKNGVAIKSEDLATGDRIRIGWLPDRACILEYEGNRRFRAVKCENSTIQPGDTFECGVMLKDYPLFVDNLTHAGETFQRYSIGTENGLSTLEKI